MQLQFYMGMNDKEIIPRKSMDDTNAHYAWCLEQLIMGLNKSIHNDESKLSLLEQFEKNMKTSPGTRKMLSEVDTLFASFLKMHPLASNEYIINCLKGLPVGDDRSYIYYTS